MSFIVFYFLLFLKLDMSNSKTNYKQMKTLKCLVWEKFAPFKKQLTQANLLYFL